MSAPAVPGIAEANRAVRHDSPFDDARDLDDERRGYLGTASEGEIRAADGRVVWDLGAYAFLGEECPDTVNPSLTGLEIAERMQLPPALEKAWHTRGYYGSVSHNTKAVYQRYMGWFDGNPAHLWEHPPTEAAARYVEFMGGAEEVLRHARESYQQGDFRWVAQVVNHVVFADPDNAAARSLQADALEQLGYGSENGTWRNFFLTGALELRHGSAGTPTTVDAPDLLGALTLDQLFDSLAIRVDGPGCWGADITVRLHIGDERDPSTLRLRNGVLTHVVGLGPAAAEADVEITVDDEAALRALLLGGVDLADVAHQGRAKVSGDPGRLAELVGYLTAPDPDFAIVTP